MPLLPAGATTPPQHPLTPGRDLQADAGPQDFNRRTSRHQETRSAGFFFRHGMRKTQPAEKISQKSAFVCQPMPRLAR